MTERIPGVAVLIVGFRNPADVVGCIDGLSDAAAEPNFDVFICENGGIIWYQQLLQELLAPEGPCRHNDQHTAPATIDSGLFIAMQCLRLGKRACSRVWIGCARENLGYAGGINSWLSQLQKLPGWKGVWVLNPDTEPEANALVALVERAEGGKKGMVGSTIIDSEWPHKVCCRGGLHWERLAARTIAIGFGERINTPHDVSAIEALMDSPSGASMYVTRSCIEQVGLMDESYFLFFDDLDWGLRAKICGMGYASASIVRHKRGTTTGTAKHLTEIPQLTIFLEYRNGIRFVRRHFPLTLPICVAVSFLYAVRFLIYRAPKNFVATVEGTLAGLRGEVGRPSSPSQRI